MKSDANGPGPQVLLVEDTAATAAIYKLYFEELGLPDPEWVETLQKAETLKPRIAAGAFDLIVSDLLLNGVDAGAFLKDIVDTTACPVIVCSGSPTAARRKDLSHCTILPKPVSLAALWRELRRHAPPRRTARKLRSREIACTRTRLV